MYFSSPALAEDKTLRGRVSQQVQAPATPQEPGVVGIHFEIRPQTAPKIMEIYPGTPAAKAGLKPGDRVLAINNQPALGLSAAEVDAAISNIPGEPVDFLIQRGGRAFKVRLTVAPVGSLSSNPVRSLYQRLFDP